MTKSTRGNSPQDIIELRLPLKPEHLPILRATTGVVAGGISFNYVEIIQLRMAVSEVFDLALKYAARGKQTSEGNELVVRFSVYTDKIIINLKFCQGLSQTEVAMHLGMSQMHVSRLERNAITKLKQILRA